MTRWLSDSNRYIRYPLQTLKGAAYGASLPASHSILAQPATSFGDAPGVALSQALALSLSFSPPIVPGRYRLFSVGVPGILSL